MIITSNTQISNSLLSAAQSRLQKPATRASAETPAASAPSDPGADQLLVTAQNIASAVSPLADTAAAQAAIQAVRKQFLAQPNVAMLAQANQLPENALRLLQ